MLAAMFAPGSSRAPGILTDGAFFLDRDPEVFKVRFLRLRAHLLHMDPSELGPKGVDHSALQLPGLELYTSFFISWKAAVDL